MAMQPTHQVIVVDDVENAERHRCLCCCCRCCHIKTACIVLMVLELIWIASVFYEAYHVWGGPLRENQLRQAQFGLQLVVAILLLIAIVICFVAITNTNPKLVIPHIAIQVLQIVVMVIAVILGIVYLTTAGKEVIDRSLDRLNQDDRYNNVFTDSDRREIGRTAVSAATVSAIIWTLLVAALEIWFIFLFLQLKRYLAEKKEMMAGGGYNMHPVPPKYGA